jgi:hypothetical protein
VLEKYNGVKAQRPHSTYLPSAQPRYLLNI